MPEDLHQMTRVKDAEEIDPVAGRLPRTELTREREPCKGRHSLMLPRHPGRQWDGRRVPRSALAAGGPAKTRYLLASSPIDGEWNPKPHAGRLHHQLLQTSFTGWA